VYIADADNCRVQKVDSSGKVILTCGSPGSADGEFSPSKVQNVRWSPYALAIDSKGNLYATDPGNFRIQKFDSSGNFKFAWGSQGSDNGQFQGGKCVVLNDTFPVPSPLGIAVDSLDNIYVVDSGNNRVQIFYEVETTRITFAPVVPENMNIYVLGSDGNLWFETGPFGPNHVPPKRLPIDNNVMAFQALGPNQAVVLGADGNLWLENWPYGDVAQTVKTRLQIDGNVAAFQTVLSSYQNCIFVLGNDGSLWHENWPPSGDVTQTIASRQVVDENVKAFWPLDVYDLVVLGSDGNLWWESIPWGSIEQTMANRRIIDANVIGAQPIDGYNIYVLGADGNLWFEPWPPPSANTPNFKGWGNVALTVGYRQRVDGNVVAFQAIDVSTTFVLGTDGNLWFETGPWGNVSQTISTRKLVASNVTSFFVWTGARGFLNEWAVLYKDTDHVLWYTVSPFPNSWNMEIDTNVM